MAISDAIWDDARRACVIIDPALFVNRRRLGPLA